MLLFLSFDLLFLLPVKFSGISSSFDLFMLKCTLSITLIFNSSFLGLIQILLVLSLLALIVVRLVFLFAADVGYMSNLPYIISLLISPSIYFYKSLISKTKLFSLFFSFLESRFVGYGILHICYTNWFSFLFTGNLSFDLGCIPLNILSVLFIQLFDLYFL